jgi:hypothetical protein
LSPVLAPVLLGFRLDRLYRLEPPDPALERHGGRARIAQHWNWNWGCGLASELRGMWRGRKGGRVALSPSSPSSPMACLVGVCDVGDVGNRPLLNNKKQAQFLVRRTCCAAGRRRRAACACATCLVCVCGGRGR